MLTILEVIQSDFCKAVNREAFGNFELEANSQMAENQAKINGSENFIIQVASI